jgi:O-antigen/teichoic acid export membrane protein
MIKKLTSLKNHQGFMKYFKNTSWLFAEKILRMVVGLFVGIWVARYLGPEQFGTFSYALSFVGMFSAIATLGLDSIVVRELVKDASIKDKLIGTAFWLKLFGAFFTLIILAIVIYFTQNDKFENILIFIIASATVFQSFNVIDFYFQSKVMSKYIVYANIFSLLLSSIVKIILILNNASLILFVFVVLFDSIILALGYIYFYFYNSLSVLKWKFDKIIALELLKDSWPLMFTISIVMMYLNINQLLIKYYYHDLSLVAYYSVANKLVTLIGFIPAILVNSLFPFLVKSSSNKIKYLQDLQILSNYFTLITLSYATIIIIFSDEIILLLYGKDYLEVSTILKYMVFLNFFSFHGYLSGRYYIIQNMEKQYLFRSILGLITLIVSSIFLIPNYAIVGAVFSLLLSEVVVVFFSDLFYFKKTKDIFLIKLKSLYLFLNYKSYFREVN